MARSRHNEPTNSIIDAGDLLRGSMGEDAPNARWGDNVTIWNNAGGVKDRVTRATLVKTPMFARNIPMAFSLRFGTYNPTTKVSTDPQPFVPFTQGPIVVTLIRSIDVRAAQVTDVITLNGGDVMPVCECLARQLTITVAYPFDPDVPAKTSAITVEAACAPVNSIDCESLSGNNGPSDLSDNTGTVNINAIGLPTAIVLEANPLRRQFFVCNPSASSALGIGLGIPVIWTAGVMTQGSFVLPPGQFATYESPLGGFTGRVYGKTDTGAVGVLVTELIEPAP